MGLIRDQGLVGPFVRIIVHTRVGTGVTTLVTPKPPRCGLVRSSVPSSAPYLQPTVPGQTPRLRTSPRKDILLRVLWENGVLGKSGRGPTTERTLSQEDGGRHQDHVEGRALGRRTHPQLATDRATVSDSSPPKKKRCPSKFVHFCLKPTREESHTVPHIL